MHVLTSDTPTVDANDYVLAKNAAETLHQHYPGHLWAVSVNQRARMLDIRNLALSGAWGFRIPLATIFSGTQLDRLVMRAGGELLERYRVQRGAANVEALQALPVNFAGHHRADV
jgi:hypothetical protein